jgi:hypothetical protein
VSAIHTVERKVNTRLRAGAVALAIAAAAAAGCGDIGPTDPYTLVSGPYILHSIDGQLMPFVFLENEEGTITITTGSITLRTDRTFSETWTARFDPVEGEPISGGFSEQGTYELSGESVVFNLPAIPGRDEGTVTGYRRGDTLSYTAGGRVVVYLD